MEGGSPPPHPAGGEIQGQSPPGEGEVTDTGRDNSPPQLTGALRGQHGQEPRTRRRGAGGGTHQRGAGGTLAAGKKRASIWGEKKKKKYQNPTNLSGRKGRGWLVGVASGTRNHAGSLCGGDGGGGRLPRAAVTGRGLGGADRAGPAAPRPQQVARRRRRSRRGHKAGEAASPSPSPPRRPGTRRRKKEKLEARPRPQTPHPRKRRNRPQNSPDQTNNNGQVRKDAEKEQNPPERAHPRLPQTFRGGGGSRPGSTKAAGPLSAPRRPALPARPGLHVCALTPGPPPPPPRPLHGPRRGRAATAGAGGAAGPSRGGGAGGRGAAKSFGWAAVTDAETEFPLFPRRQELGRAPRPRPRPARPRLSPPRHRAGEPPPRRAPGRYLAAPAPPLGHGARREGAPGCGGCRGCTSVAVTPAERSCIPHPNGGTREGTLMLTHARPPAQRHPLRDSRTGGPTQGQPHRKTHPGAPTKGFPPRDSRTGTSTQEDPLRVPHSGTPAQGHPPSDIHPGTPIREHPPRDTAQAPCPRPY